MDKWEYKVLYSLSEDELNKWGEEGYKIFSIIPPPPPSTYDGHEIPEYRARHTTVVLKRRK